MDKYEGINRPETVLCEISYQTAERKNFISKERKHESKVSAPKNVLAIIRYVVCALLLSICLIGKFTEFKPVKQVCGYIKTELSKDTLAEFAGKNENKG